jgi:hypothetical protein
MVTPLAQDVVDIVDAIETTTIYWSVPKMQTATGDKLRVAVCLLIVKLKEQWARGDRAIFLEAQNNELRDLCDLLTKRVQELEERRLVNR